VALSRAATTRELARPGRTVLAQRLTCTASSFLRRPADAVESRVRPHVEPHVEVEVIESAVHAGGPSMAEAASTETARTRTDGGCELYLLEAGKGQMPDALGGCVDKGCSTRGRGRRVHSSPRRCDGRDPPVHNAGGRPLGRVEHLENVCVGAVVARTAPAGSSTLPTELGDGNRTSRMRMGAWRERVPRSLSRGARARGPSRNGTAGVSPRRTGVLICCGTRHCRRDLQARMT